MENFKTFEDLECWKEARKLSIHVKINILSKFPENEKFDLTLQLSRSSRFIGNNISEGFGRFHYQENIQFCGIARGSLTEIAIRLTSYQPGMIKWLFHVTY